MTSGTTPTKLPNSITDGQILAQVTQSKKVAALLIDAEALLELDAEGGGLDDFAAQLDLLDPALSDVEVALILSGDDHRNAIVEIHPGAGSLEAQDWADRARVYLRWAERRGFVAELPIGSTEMGLGSKAPHCAWSGRTPRLVEERTRRAPAVRISPFVLWRQASFAAVDVIAEIDDDIKINPGQKICASTRSKLRRRRAACERDRQRGTYHPHPDRYRGVRTSAT
ncbi:MAG: PCRF domain-containing protein [Acidobacteriota bacterium]